ncbi:uncharacterized protein Z519_05236 [Cladophialophora bantiana CBS 173.52]|uniref:Uncharacterized protein n=1 Tax=Cladophialophora bantiana (strain ATCC 10958 / CBS 173.52 / CDC B-1940 / NIH 8579) TaxID=1442370 RepID=A0A0D2EVR6_CLAB1|nr:uncharacterized protein Z519_05236 [Cladophialophora bantiana CBS 173.52]KIW93921.1 hypothetical protein Z519_05236 [Cladophialophora bantiana CBS 173.52]
MPEHHRHRPRSHSRSRSPYRHDRRPSHDSHRSRSHKPHDQRTKHSLAPRKPLPYGARELSRHDLPAYRPLFALYLDIQKQLNLENLDDAEVKGRWKSFVQKWNRGELAQGWYDSETLDKARARDQVSSDSDWRTSTKRNQEKPSDSRPLAQDDNETEEEVDFGPTLPSSLTIPMEYDDSVKSRGHGASIPSLEDLRARDEHATEEAHATRREHAQQLRHERQQDRKFQKERLDDLLPRAEPGTRERQLEKRRERAEANRFFAVSKDASGDVDVVDSDLMGEDGLAELKKMQKEQERKKSEKELRREEVLRARRAERERRLQAVKEKEEKTMSIFREIARQRFGAGEAS